MALIPQRIRRVHPGPTAFFLVELSVRLSRSPGDQDPRGFLVSGKGKSPCSLTYWENIVGKAAGWPATGFETRVARYGAWGSRPLPTANGTWGCMEWPPPCHGGYQAGSLPACTAIVVNSSDNYHFQILSGIFYCNNSNNGSLAQMARALLLQGRGRVFDPHRIHS